MTCLLHPSTSVRGHVFLRSPVFWQYMLRLELPLFDD